MCQNICVFKGTLKFGLENTNNSANAKFHFLQEKSYKYVDQKRYILL